MYAVENASLQRSAYPVEKLEILSYSITSMKALWRNMRNYAATRIITRFFFGKITFRIPDSLKSRHFAGGCSEVRSLRNIWTAQMRSHAFRSSDERAPGRPQMKRTSIVLWMAMALASPVLISAQEATPSPASLTQAEMLSQQKDLITKQKDLLDAQRAYLDVFRQTPGGGLSDRERAGGKTEYNTEQGTVFETVILSYDALREIALKIDERLAPALSRYDRVAVYYEPDFNALSRYRLYREQARIALENYEAFLKQLNEEAARVRQNKEIGIKSIGGDNGSDFLTALAAPSIATAAVRSVAELASLFRTDRTVTTSTVSVRPEVPGVVLTGVLLKAHPGMSFYNSESFVADYELGVGSSDSFYNDIVRLNAAEAYLTYLLDEFARQPEKVQNASPFNRLIARAKAAKTQIAGLSFSLKPGQLSAAETTEMTEFRRMVRAERLDRFLSAGRAPNATSKVGVLKITLLSAGGSRRESRNLILGNKTDYSGSAVVEVVLYDLDGTLRASEVYSHHTGFRKFRTDKR